MALCKHLYPQNWPLKRSRMDVSARHKIAESISTQHEESMRCCGAIHALAREMPLFRDGGALREVMYPTLKEKMLQVCLSHLTNIDIDVLTAEAAIAVIVELSLDGERGIPDELLAIGINRERSICFLTEIARRVLRGPRQSGSLKRSAELIEAINQIARDDDATRQAIRGAAAAALRLIRSTGSFNEVGQRDGLAASWEICSRLLKKHGPIAAGIDNLLGVVNARRSAEELVEFYTLSWLERVKRPIEEELLPALSQFQQSRLPKLQGGRWPLNASSLLDLRARMAQVEGRFRRLLDLNALSRGEDLPAILDDLRALQALLFGDDSAFLSLLSGLVLTDLRRLSTYLRATAESLEARGISCALRMDTLPGRRGAFVSLPDLLTCLDALVSNVLRHAFPSEYLGERRTAISANVEEDGRFVLAVEDSGVGQLDELENERSAGGLIDVQAFATAYGGRVEKQMLLPGVKVSIRWEVVDI